MKLYKSVGGKQHYITDAEIARFASRTLDAEIIAGQSAKHHIFYIPTDFPRQNSESRDKITMLVGLGTQVDKRRYILSCADFHFLLHYVITIH